MEKKHPNITALAVLMVFTLYALCVLGVLMAGAETYSGLTQRGTDSFSYRTAAQYLTQRIRQADTAGGILLGDFEGQDALMLPEQIDDETYMTRIYCHDGWLRELYAAKTAAFSPEDGEKLLEMNRLSFFQNGSILNAEWELPDGTVQSFVFCLHSMQEVAP